MKTLMIAGAAAAFAACAAPSHAQAPNDAAATLAQGKAYSDSKTPSHRKSYRSASHGTASRRASSASSADSSADQLNAKELSKGGS